MKVAELATGSVPAGICSRPGEVYRATLTGWSTVRTVEGFRTSEEAILLIGTYAGPDGAPRPDVVVRTLASIEADRRATASHASAVAALAEAEVEREARRIADAAREAAEKSDRANRRAIGAELAALCGHRSGHHFGMVSGDKWTAAIRCGAVVCARLAVDYTDGPDYSGWGIPNDHKKTAHWEATPEGETELRKWKETNESR